LCDGITDIKTLRIIEIKSGPRCWGEGLMAYYLEKLILKMEWKGEETTIYWV